MEHLGQEPKTVKGRDLGNPGRKRCRKIQEKEDKNSQYICPVMPCNQSTLSYLLTTLLTVLLDQQLHMLCACVCGGLSASSWRDWGASVSAKLLAIIKPE